jgi:hypothetical protein
LVCALLPVRLKTRILRSSKTDKSSPQQRRFLGRLGCPLVGLRAFACAPENPKFFGFQKRTNLSPSNAVS